MDCSAASQAVSGAARGVPGSGEDRAGVGATDRREAPSSAEHAALGACGQIPGVRLTSQRTGPPDGRAGTVSAVLASTSLHRPRPPEFALLPSVSNVGTIQEYAVPDRVSGLKSMRCTKARTRVRFSSSVPSRSPGASVADRHERLRPRPFTRSECEPASQDDRAA